MAVSINRKDWELINSNLEMFQYSLNIYKSKKVEIIAMQVFFSALTFISILVRSMPMLIFSFAGKAYSFLRLQPVKPIWYEPRRDSIDGYRTKFDIFKDNQFQFPEKYISYDFYIPMEVFGTDKRPHLEALLSHPAVSDYEINYQNKIVLIVIK